MILKLPAQINAPRFRKDNSCSLSFDTRELSAEELMYILGVRQAEGWLLFSTEGQNLTIEDVPVVKATLDLKSHSERLRDIIFVLYKQATQDQKFVGDFETFYKSRMEQLIAVIKGKLHD